VDFRINGDWNLIKQAIEAQPGPPPAHGVVIDYDLSTNTVNNARPFTTAFTGTDNQAAHAPEVISPLSPGGGVVIGGNTPRLLREPARPPPGQPASPPAPAAIRAKAPACSQTLADLRNEVTVIQKTLEGLNKSMEHNSEAREESEKEIDKSMEEGKDKLIGAFIKLTGAVFDDRMEEATEQTQQAVLKRMQDNISPGQRQQYDAAFKILSGQKKELAQVIGRFENLDRANSLKEIDEGLARHDATALEQFYDNGTKLVNDPLVQKALKFSKPATKALKVIDAFQGDLDAGYLLGSEYLSWQNIKQLDKNTDQYLKAVNSLRDKLKAVVARIKTVESEMRESGYAGCSQ
jgi:hypothetical protein